MNQISTDRYPDFRVPEKWSTPDFDDQTREVLRKRLDEIPPIRFFTAHEADTLSAIVDCIVPQPERSGDAKIPVTPWIDEKLFKDERDGYRYEDLPVQRKAWQLGLKAVDETSKLLFGGQEFVQLDLSSRNSVLRQIENGEPKGETWKQLPARRFFKSVLLTTIVKIYYSHPFAWSEIGYSGPSSPRGHVRNWEGGVDPWEAHHNKEKADKR